jgi:NitT/TauT family transport system substrate-binding protein
MKKAVILVILFSLVLLTACGKSASNETGSTAGDGKLEKIQLLLAAEGNAVYYTYVARDKGYFEEEGLDVELVFGKGGTYVVQQIGAETVDIGVTAVSTLLPAWEKGIDIQAVYQINVSNLFEFMVPKDSTISDISQLKGKVVGVTDLGGGEVPMVRSILSTGGLDATKDVTLRAIGSEASSILTAFEKGDVDAFSGGAHDLVSLYANGFKSKSLIPEEYKKLPSTAIIANGKFVKERPEIVEKVSRAIAKATDFSINDPDATFEIMKKAAPEQNKDEEIGRLFLDTFIELSTPIEPEKGYGYIYQDSWKQLVQQFSEGDNPVITKKININDYLNTSFLEKANKFK